MKIHTFFFIGAIVLTVLCVMAIRENTLVIAGFVGDIAQGLALVGAVIYWIGMRRERRRQRQC